MSITPDWFEFAPSAADWAAWAPVIFAIVGIACVLVGLIGGEVSRRRERKRLQAFLTPGRTATVADIEERRWRRHQQRFGAGGDDNAA